MAKKKTKDPSEKEEEKKTDPYSQIMDIIASEKQESYGVLTGDELDAYRDEYISTGSSRLDLSFGGGFRPGFSLFYGDEETGKTAQGLTWGLNWQKKYGEKGWVILFDAESRMTEYKIKQSGIDTSRFIWSRGIVAESIFSTIDKLALNNPEGNRYFFILDSLDAIMRKEDREKTFLEAPKVGGAATILSLAGKRLSAPIHAFGHHLYQISQIRAKDIIGGAKSAPKPSGGNAGRFYADIMGRFKKGWSDTFIKDGEKIIGNKTEIHFTKSYNEITNQKIDVPIKYRHKGGVWREYEAFMHALEWSFIEQKGSWIKFTDVFKQFCENDKLEAQIPDAIQGELKTVRFFEDNPIVSEYIINKVFSLAA